jgi:hypothetical protein
MTRKERRAKVLAERKLQKKAKPAPAGELYGWMAGLLPSAGGRVLEVGAHGDGTAALQGRGWKVVPIDAGAVLAQGEFQGDTVDAVTCWLLEVPRGKPALAEKLAAMGLRTPEETRLALQTLVYRLADRVLRPGGILQVVDRSSAPLDEAMATGLMRLQRAQAKGTTLEFASIDARPAGRGALVSVRSRKA